MAKLIECIPNFSEGRNQEVIDGLVAVAKSVPGVILLDHSSDTSHNRSVFTLVGDEKGIEEVAVKLGKFAKENIDLRKHEGEHPRMGAMDVCPFVPIKDATMEDCIEISKKVAKRLFDEEAIPVFLYEASATASHRQNLAKVRKGQFEGMAEKIKDPDWYLDYGTQIHESFGVVAVGARMPLIAYNIDLDTTDVTIANNIAKLIRGSSGGYAHCKAMGVENEKGMAQVSMNMVNFEGTSLYRVFETVKFEARKYGVNITNSEIVGLTPAKALVDCAEYYLQIKDFDYKKQVLENHILG